MTTGIIWGNRDSFFATSSDTHRPIGYQDEKAVTVIAISGLLSFVWVNFHKSGKNEVNILSLRYTRSLIP